MAEQGPDKSQILKIVEKQNVRSVRLWFTDILGFLKSFEITCEMAPLKKAVAGGAKK